MLLYINGRFLTQRPTGVQVFARGLVAELAQHFQLTILVPLASRRYDNEFEGLIKPIGHLKGHLWEQISLPHYLKRKKNARLLNLCNTAPLLFKNQIITIHDLAFRVNPKWFNPFFYTFYNFLIPLIIKQSKHIITVSHSIKEEIVNSFDNTNSKVSIIGNKTRFLKNNKIIAPTFEEKLELNRFFLIIGSQNERKNTNLVIEHFERNLPNETLVVVGGKHKSFRNHKSQKTASNLIHLNYVNDNNLQWLYSNAIALINPALYEGFGLTNIEAMQNSCTVICSDIPVFKEVCGESAFFFTSNSSQSLDRTIKTVLKNGVQIEEKKEKGFKRVDFYNKQDRAQLFSIIK